MDDYAEFSLGSAAEDKVYSAVTENIAEYWVAYSTHIGTRKYQQDDVKIPDKNKQKESKNICVLSDGMGGMQGGEIASNLTVNTLFDDFYNQKVENCPAFFSEEIKKVDALVAGIKDETGKTIESGATLVSIVIDGNNLYWASVGDSRIYIIRGDEIAQVNAEHNYYMMLKNRVEAGEITEEEARNDPSKEASISYIGIGGVELADINQEPFSLENGDLIVLCSDGLYRILNDEAIKLIVRSCSENIPLAAHMLVNTATENRQNNQDNTTAIVVKYKQ